jgi:hypothetical protein
VVNVVVTLFRRFSAIFGGKNAVLLKNNVFGRIKKIITLVPGIIIPPHVTEFIKAPTEVNLIGVNGGKVECVIFGVPKPKVVWYKDFHPLKETHRVQAHHYPPQVKASLHKKICCQSGKTVVIPNLKKIINYRTTDPNVVVHTTDTKSDFRIVCR